MIKMIRMKILIILIRRIQKKIKKYMEILIWLKMFKMKMKKKDIYIQKEQMKIIKMKLLNNYK